MWLLPKSSPLQRLRSDLGQGQALMVVLSCLNVQKRLCSGDRVGMKLLPSKLKTKSGGTCGPQALGCCMPAMSTQQGQPGGSPQKPSLASCPWLLVPGGHPGWELHKTKPRKFTWLCPQPLRAGAALRDASRSHTPSLHIMCSCSSSSQLL